MFLAFHAATRGLDITPPRFTALVIVGANPGIGQSALGQVLGIARSGAMMLTDWMEERGLVERRRRPNDGRSWGVHLTARGEELLARMKRRVIAEDRKRAGCSMRASGASSCACSTSSRDEARGAVPQGLARPGAGGGGARRAGGSPALAAPLGPYPARLTERLLHWARECPERDVPRASAMPAAAGARSPTARRWQSRAPPSARRCSSAGFPRSGRSLILSDNDIEHALLALAGAARGRAFVAGVVGLLAGVAPTTQAAPRPRAAHARAGLRRRRRALREGDRRGGAGGHRGRVPRLAEATLFAAPNRRRSRWTPRTPRSAGHDRQIPAHLRLDRQPKAVINTQRMLCSNQQMIAQCAAVPAEAPPVLVDWLPWNHTVRRQPQLRPRALQRRHAVHRRRQAACRGLIEKTLRNLREIAPTIYFNVPRGFEELRAAPAARARAARASSSAA